MYVINVNNEINVNSVNNESINGLINLINHKTFNGLTKRHTLLRR